MTEGQSNGKKGGRRPGAGAPKGNKNAFRNGNETDNQRLALAWHSLTPEQREMWRPIVKSAGAAFDVAWLEEVASADAKVRLIKGASTPVGPSHDAGLIAPQTPQYTHTHTDTINNNQLGGSQPLLRERELEVIRTLRAWGFFSAEGFVEAHVPALDLLERLIEEIKTLEEDLSEPVFRSKAAAFRDAVHEALMVQVGNMRQCPYCGKRQALPLRLLGETERQSS